MLAIQWATACPHRTDDDSYSTADNRFRCPDCLAGDPPPHQVCDRCLSGRRSAVSRLSTVAGSTWRCAGRASMRSTPSSAREARRLWRPREPLRDLAAVGPGEAASVAEFAAARAQGADQVSDSA
jgi:hypothetical protein